VEETEKVALTANQFTESWVTLFQGKKNPASGEKGEAKNRKSKNGKRNRGGHW